MATLRSRLARAWAGWTGAKSARSAYAGAVSSRLTADWIFAPVTSADQEIRGDLRTLRARARELARNNAYAARFLDLVAENVIGPSGIDLQARVTKADGEMKGNANDAIEAAWAEWGEPENCTVDGRLAWCDVQELAVRTRAQDGEYLIRMHRGFPNRFGFALEVLDPDLLDVEHNRAAERGQNAIRMGVEVDLYGRPLAYWLWSSHPGEVLPNRDRARVRVPAEEILHGFLMKRPGQTRGVTDFAPVLLDLKMLGGYQEAELVAARTAAAKMGFFKQEPDAVVDPNGFNGAAQITTEAAPGTFDMLPPGVSFEAWDPQHPTSAFGEFNKAILRGLATGLGVSYNSLSNDLEGVNYSSIRAGLLAERDVWRRLTRHTITHLHRRVYREWLKWALLSEALVLASMDPRRYYAVAWQPRGWTWVDPLKDIQAAKEAIGAGLDSRTRLAAEQGRDFEEILADLDHEQQLAAEYGVTLSTGNDNANQNEGADESAEADAGGGDRSRPLRAVRRVG